MRKALHAIWVGAALAACGAIDKPSSHTVTEYYVEGGTAPGAGDAVVQSGTPAGMAVQFMTPTGAVQGGGAIAVKVQLTAPDAAATWSLYYAAAADDSDAKEIAKNTPAATTTVSWNTASVAPGTYHLYVILADAGETGKFKASAVVTVAAPAAPAAPAGTPPAGSAGLAVPNGQEVFVAGTPRAITFTPHPAAGATLAYTIDYSPDGGTTWTNIASKQATASYMWDVAGLAQGTAYKVRVTADDGKGNTTVIVSANPFGVAATPMTYAAGFGALLKARCAACHDAAKANVLSFEDDNYALAGTGVQALASKIQSDIASNRMPTTAPLTAAEKDVVTLWIWSGAH